MTVLELAISYRLEQNQTSINLGANPLPDKVQSVSEDKKSSMARGGIRWDRSLHIEQADG